MKTIHRYLILLVILPLAIILSSCSKTAENEHLPEYCQTYSGFMATASKDFYELIGGINRFNYLTVISEIELEFEESDPTKEIDLSGIQCFQNLTSLTLIGQSFKDISPISALKNIQKITLIDTSIVSIDSFKNLSKIKELTISNSKSLQSVDGVQEMTKLTSLDLSDNGIVNIDGLNNLINLTELNLSNNKITYFPSINQLDKLTILNVSNNQINQLGEDLSGLRNLISFDATYNDICDLSTLDDLLSLEYLDLSFNDLGCGGAGVSPDFSSLENSPNLSEIYLNDNNLSSIEDLRGKNLPLEILHLENNVLTDITPIGAFTGLNELYLYNNKIVNIDDLSGMINLRTIDLSTNLIVDFSDLLSIPNLQAIDLSNNMITSIPDLVTLSDIYWTELVSLDLNSNLLTDISGIEAHPNLEELNISNNGLTELSGLSNLPLLNSLIVFREIPEVIPDDFEYEDFPNDINVIRNSFNNLPSLNLTNSIRAFDFGFELGENIQIYNSISNLENVISIDFSEMDISVIDEFSINLDSLLLINVANTNISDIRFILGNTSLQQIDISGTNVTNLSVISGVDTNDLDDLAQVNALNINVSNVLLNAFIDLPDLNYIDLSGTNIDSIENSFNNLFELATLRIDSTELNSIISSFNNLFAVYTTSNVFNFNNGKLAIVSDSFNYGNYNYISIIGNVPDTLITSISNSFNNISVRNVDSILISGNDFKAVSGSFNEVEAINLFLANNGIETITNSFANLDLGDELNIQNNKISSLEALDNVLNVPSLDLSNNILTTVSFIDGIPGLVTLDISNQYDSDLSVRTLDKIDGINNMVSLTIINMNQILITEIDGFKDIGIASFIFSVSNNNLGIITSITSDSFSNSHVTELNLDGHNLDNIDFLNNFSFLTDLTISIDLPDLSGFQDSGFEGTLQSLTLENIQESSDFSYLSEYDSLTFLSFTSDLTLSINNFEGLDQLININFDNRLHITSFNNSFNNLPSLSISETYLNNFSSLTSITSSFDIYTLSDTVEVQGSYLIVDSFNFVGEVVLYSDTETIMNFDTFSFDNMESITIKISNHDSYASLNGYVNLTSVVIEELNKNITDLDNSNITSLSIEDMGDAVDLLTLDISPIGMISFTNTFTDTVTLNALNDKFELLIPNGSLVLNIENINATLHADSLDFTLNSSTLTSVILSNYTSINTTFNTDLLNEVSRSTYTEVNATTFDINTLEAVLNINVSANDLNINDSFANIYNIVVMNGDAYLNGLQPSITVEFTGNDLYVQYDLLETINLIGTLDNIFVDSANLDSILLNDSFIDVANITSNQSSFTLEGSNVSTINLINNSIENLYIDSLNSITTLTTTNNLTLDIFIDANEMVLNSPNVPILILDTLSSLTSLNILDGAAMDTLTFNNALISNTYLLSNVANMNVTGTNISEIVIDADNLATLTASTPTATYDINSLTPIIALDIIATSVLVDSPNMTDLSFSNSSIIGNVSILESNLIDTINSNSAIISSLNVMSNSSGFNLTGINILNSTINDNNLGTLIADVGNNTLNIISTRTGGTTFDLIAGDVVLDLAVSFVSISNTSNINLLDVSSSNLTYVLSGAAVITTLNITNSSAGLGVDGLDIANLNVVENITTFDANVSLVTNVNLNTSASTLVSVTTQSSDIVITSLGDIDLTSATLESATFNLGTNSASLNLSKVSLDFSIAGIMDVLEINSSTMDSLSVESGVIISSLELTDTSFSTLDFSNGTIRNLSVTSSDVSATSLDIIGNDLSSVTIDVDNLNSLSISSTNPTTVVSLLSSAASLNLAGNVTQISIDSISLNNLSITPGFQVDTLQLTNTNVSTLDFGTSTVANLLMISPVTTLNISGDSLQTIVLETDNLSSLTASSSYVGASLNIITLAASLDLNGTIDDVYIVHSSVSSIDLAGTSYKTFHVQSDNLLSLDTISNISDLLDIYTTQSNFSLSTDTGVVSFNSLDTATLNLSTTIANMELSTNVDTINFDAASTSFIINGDNLNQLNGVVDEINFDSILGSEILTLDLDGNLVSILNTGYSQIDFIGVRTIDSIIVGSTSLDTLNTNTVNVNSLTVQMAAANIDIDSQATNITAASFASNGVSFEISVDGQTINSAMDFIVLNSSNLNSTVLNYTGTNTSSVSFNGMQEVIFNAPNTSTLSLDGDVVDLTITGNNIGLVDTSSLFVSNRYTMNNTLITDLSFVSNDLTSGLNELEINTLSLANIGSIIEALRDTSITLYSPITASNIYNYYYDLKLSELTALEVLNNVRYDGYRAAAIQDAYDVIRTNIYFNYVTETVLRDTIDSQSYGDMQYYFDGYLLDEGKTEEELVTDYGLSYVQSIKDSIQLILDNPLLIILEEDLNDLVVNSIISDSTSYATTESGLVGFIIG